MKRYWSVFVVLGAVTACSTGSSSTSGGTSGTSGSAAQCGPPAIATSTTLGVLTEEQRGLLCDYFACPGGYGEITHCEAGPALHAFESKSECVQKSQWKAGCTGTVADLIACGEGDPCVNGNLIPACQRTYGSTCL